MALIANEYAGGEITQEQLLEAAIQGMTTILDSYSEYMNAADFARFTGDLSGKLVGIGVHIRLNEDKRHEIVRVLPDTPAREAKLARGDIFLSVNGRPTEGLGLDEVIALIGDPQIMNVKLEIQRGDKTIPFQITKREIPSISVYTETLGDLLGVKGAAYDAVRYIAVTSISENTAEALKSVIERLKKDKIDKIIIDLRGNTGGYLGVAVDICNLLVPKGPVLITEDAFGHRETMYSHLDKTPFSQTVVLVDRYTASGAEIIAAALQDAGVAVIIGETTFGKGVIQSMYTLSTGGALKLTTEEYFRRSGGKINEVGIEPNHRIESDYKKIGTGEDTPLLKAVSLLTGR
jgi:carboxyl-terminal processing protease